MPHCSLHTEKEINLKQIRGISHPRIFLFHDDFGNFLTIAISQPIR